MLPSENAIATICLLLPITFPSTPAAGSALPSVRESRAAGGGGICKGEIARLSQKPACSGAEQSMSILQVMGLGSGSEATPLCFLLPSDLTAVDAVCTS